MFSRGTSEGMQGWNLGQYERINTMTERAMQNNEKYLVVNPANEPDKGIRQLIDDFAEQI